MEDQDFWIKWDQLRYDFHYTVKIQSGKSRLHELLEGLNVIDLAFALLEFFVNDRGLFSK